MTDADGGPWISSIMKTPPKKSRLLVWKYLHAWDVSSLQRRNDIVRQFIDDYTTIDPIDTDHLFTRAGGLIFTRFTVGMQLAFARRKPVSHYFQALCIFIRSLQGERYIVEFTLMGALISTFEVLRVDEMKDKDKSHVFQFLIRMIEGCGGTRVKIFICSDTSYLESVVDCLTMCKSRTVIHHARLFFQYMCQGNTMTNICMVSKYVISLLPCDFNPRVQALACRVLPTIIHQNADIASHCYSLVVDALKTDYNDMLVDIGELCLVIMETPDGKNLLTSLMEAALPGNVSENLETCQATQSNAGMNAAQSTLVNSRFIRQNMADAAVKMRQRSKLSQVYEQSVKSNYVTHDTYFRQQYGALFTLSFMLKNNPDLADGMVEKGIVGSVLAAIGTAPYPEIQLIGIRLLMLVHELSPDCAASLVHLLPKNLLVVLLSEVEDGLQYLTAPMCVALRKIGRAVQKNWQEWFDGVVLPTTTTTTSQLKNGSRLPSPKAKFPTPLVVVNQEITNFCQTLAELTREGLYTIADSMAILYLDEHYRDYILSKTGTTSKSLASTAKLSASSASLQQHQQQQQQHPQSGEAQIRANPSLEGFRKYLVKHSTSSAAATAAATAQHHLDIGGITGDGDVGGGGVGGVSSSGGHENFDKIHGGHFSMGGDENFKGSMTDMETALLQDALKGIENGGFNAEQGLDNEEEQEQQQLEGGGTEEDFVETPGIIVDNSGGGVVAPGPDDTLQVTHDQ